MLIVTYICILLRIGRWSEPRFVFVCQLVEVIRDAEANVTYGKVGLELLRSLVGEPQLRISKFEPEIMVSIIIIIIYSICIALYNALL